MKRNELLRMAIITLVVLTVMLSGCAASGAGSAGSGGGDDTLEVNDLFKDIPDMYVTLPASLGGSSTSVSSSTTVDDTFLAAIPSVREQGWYDLQSKTVANGFLIALVRELESQAAAGSLATGQVLTLGSQSMFEEQIPMGKARIEVDGDKVTAHWHTAYQGSSWGFEAWAEVELVTGTGGSACIRMDSDMWEGTDRSVGERHLLRQTIPDLSRQEYLTVEEFPGKEYGFIYAKGESDGSVALIEKWQDVDPALLSEYVTWGSDTGGGRRDSAGVKIYDEEGYAVRIDNQYLLKEVVTAADALQSTGSTPQTDPVNYDEHSFADADSNDLDMITYLTASFDDDVNGETIQWAAPVLPTDQIGAVSDSYDPAALETPVTAELDTLWGTLGSHDLTTYRATLVEVRELAVFGSF